MNMYVVVVMIFTVGVNLVIVSIATQPHQQILQAVLFAIQLILHTLMVLHLLYTMILYAQLLHHIHPCVTTVQIHIAQSAPVLMFVHIVELDIIKVVQIILAIVVSQTASYVWTGSTVRLAIPHTTSIRQTSPATTASQTASYASTGSVARLAIPHTTSIRQTAPATNASKIPSIRQTSPATTVTASQTASSV